MRFHSGEIEVQNRAGVRDIANEVGEGILDFVPPDAAEFLSRRQMAVLGTVDSRGRTLQLTGDASIDWNPERAKGFPGAERVVDFQLDEIIHTPVGFPLVAKFRQFSRFNPKP